MFFKMKMYLEQVCSMSAKLVRQRNNKKRKKQKVFTFIYIYFTVIYIFTYIYRDCWLSVLKWHRGLADPLPAGSSPGSSFSNEQYRRRQSPVDQSTYGTCPCNWCSPPSTEDVSIMEVSVPKTPPPPCIDLVSDPSIINISSDDDSKNWKKRIQGQFN